MDKLPENASCNRKILVENGVDLQLWPTPKIAQSSDLAEPIFVFLGRLVDWKAVDILLEAVAQVVRKIPIRLKIVGSGPMEAALKKLAANLGIASSVDFLGFVPQVACPPLLSDARALVLPSLYECGGAVVLEAMCASRPVIATDWGGPSEYLDQECGFLIKPDSRQHMVSELARTMTLLAQDHDLARRMGRAGYRRVKEHFDWELKISTILDHYMCVLRDRGREMPTLPSGKWTESVA